MGECGKFTGKEYGREGRIGGERIQECGRGGERGLGREERRGRVCRGRTKKLGEGRGGLVEEKGGAMRKR